MVAIWTTPGGSSPERRPTVRILKPLLSSVRSPKLFGAGSPNTAPKKRLVSGGILQRRQQKNERVNEGLRAPGGATRQASGGGATTSTTSAERRREYRQRDRGTGNLTKQF